MRGQPWIRALLAAIAFALAGLPLWRLTRTARGGATAPESVVPTAGDSPALPPKAPIPMHVEVTFSAPPGEWTLRSLGTVVLVGRGPEQTFAGDWTAALPKEGADLALQASWPPEPGATPPGPRAVHVLVSWPDGSAAADRTFWMPAGDGGNLGEIITVSPPATGDRAP